MDLHLLPRNGRSRSAPISTTTWSVLRNSSLCGLLAVPVGLTATTAAGCTIETVVKGMDDLTATIDRNTKCLNQRIDDLAAIKQQDGVAVLASGARDGADLIFEDTIEISQPGILMISASGASSYLRKGGANAGVMTLISVDSQACGRDRSFEGTSNTIRFFASASCALALDAGRHNIKVEVRPQPSLGKNGSEDPFMWMRFFVIARK